MFVPQRIFVSPKSQGLPKTDEIIRRTQKYNPAVIVADYDGKFEYPIGLNGAEMYHYMKDSVLISERSQYSFIKSFPSPGNIVENFNTILNLSWQCALKCEFCYLQTTRPYEHYFYTNLADLEEELSSAVYAHRAILTLWSMMSFAMKKQLLKIPFNLFEQSDVLREDFARIGIMDDREAIDRLFISQDDVYDHLMKNPASSDYPMKKSDFVLKREPLEILYNKNLHQSLILNASEFNDLLAIDHLTGYADHIMRLLPKLNDTHIKIRSKAAYVDELIKHDGLNRVRIIINLNTPHVIDSYEHGTASLDERIEAASKIQQAKGFALQLTIEPMIYYDGCIDDYKKLVQKVIKNIDRSKIAKLSIGAVRYKQALPSMMRSHFPNTNLLDDVQNLQPADIKDRRQRYTEDRRVQMYNEVFKEFGQLSSGTSVELGAETAAVWDLMNVDKNKYIGQGVFQYSEEHTSSGDTEMNSTPQEGKNSDVQVSNELPIEKSEPSLSYLCALASAGRAREVIDPDKFLEAEGVLNVMDKKWEKKYPNSIDKALRKPTWEPVKIIGWIAQISLPESVKIKDNQSGEWIDEKTYSMTITDARGALLECLQIPISSVGENLRKVKDVNKRVIFCGSIVPVGLKRKNVYRFYLKHVEQVINAEDLIEIDKNVVTAVKDTFEREASKSPRGVFNHIRETLIEKFEIKEAEPSSSMGKCIDFMILQSLSTGMNSKGVSNKLHSLVIGPPGSGKKFLHQIAAILNPVYVQVSSVSGKVNTAAVVANVSKKGISEPGYLPKASEGTLCIQDIHQLKAGRPGIFAALAEAMEDGKATDSTSTRTTHEAVTSIHVDLNRMSQVMPGSKTDSYSDIKIPLNVISRFDFIVDIPADLEQRTEVVRGMFTGSTELTSWGSYHNTEIWQRQLQQIVAYLRTYFRDVTIPVDVNAYADERIQSIVDDNDQLLKSSENNALQSNLTRIGRSVHKFVKAIACARHDTVAKKEDVDRAFEFIDEKVKFLQNYEPVNLPESSGDTRSEEKEKRKRLILTTFGEREFATAEVKTLYESLEKKVNERQVSRDLSDMEKGKLLQQVRQGKWQAIGVEPSDSKEKIEAKL